MYGFSLVVVLVAVLVAVGGDARAEAPPTPRSPLLRGLLTAAVAAAATLFTVHVFFWELLGRFGVTYFSPRAIIAVGGVGAEFFNARENASTAIVYYATAFTWTTLVLSLGFRSWPWEGSTPRVRAFSRFVLASLLAVVAYAVLFHPHVTQLFYPAQTMAGVPPWWAEFAQTSSAYFNLGWVIAAVAVLVVTDVLWGGWPWRLVGEGGPIRGIAAAVGSAGVGAGLSWLALRGMELAWGEAFQGGQYTDAPYFRYLHVAELGGFLLLATFASDTFFGAPRTAAGRILRTGLVVAAAAALDVFYYSPLATRLLGKVQGIAQPEDTPLVWTLLFLALVLVQREVIGRWRLARAAEQA
jgi:hypothetical protein